MTLFETLLLYFSAATSAFLLIAGGWVKIRDWFKAHAEAKAQEAAAAAKAEAERMKQAGVHTRLTSRDGPSFVRPYNSRNRRACGTLCRYETRP